MILTQYISPPGYALPRHTPPNATRFRCPPCPLHLPIVQPLQPCLRHRDPVLKPHRPAQPPPFVVPSPRLRHQPLHLQKLPEIDRRHGTSLITLFRPLWRPNLRRELNRLLCPHARVLEKLRARRGRGVWAQGGWGRLLGERDGEVVHQDDGVAGCRRREGDGLEIEGGGEVVV